MGLAWVQNDCKTKWIPNIWKNEETGGVTCKALAPADVWVPLRLPLELGASDGGGRGGEQEEGSAALPLRRLLSRCEREGPGFSEPKPKGSDSLRRADQGSPGLC